MKRGNWLTGGACHTGGARRKRDLEEWHSCAPEISLSIAGREGALRRCVDCRDR